MPGDPLDAELARWIAEARVDEAVAARVRERNLRLVRSEEANLVGLLVDLAEARRVVLLRTTAGRLHRGHVVAVGADFVAFRDLDGQAVLLPVTSISSLRPAPGGSPTRVRDTVAAGERRAPLDARFVDVLTGLAPERPRVRITASGDPDPLPARLRACGADVVSLEMVTVPPSVCWMPLRSVLEVDLLDER